MARIAIVGVGAIGGALAGLLETAGGHTLTLCTRRPLEMLAVTMPEGTVRVEARNLTDPAQAEPVDWVLVATKAYDAAGAAAWFPALCTQSAPVAIVQNGVEHRERFAPYLSAERLLPVMIDCPVERTDDGRVTVRGGALIKMEDTALGRSLAGLFAGSGAQVEPTDDFTTALWWKLSLNSVGALNAMTLQPSGLLRDETMGRLAVAMAEESAAVGRAEGAHLSETIGEDVLALYRRHPEDFVNSLLADRLAGRRMEWDARNGAVVRFGEKHGIATPLNRMATALLAAMEGKKR